jgi:hypothetical protein
MYTLGCLSHCPILLPSSLHLPPCFKAELALPSSILLKRKQVITRKTTFLLVEIRIAIQTDS